MAGVLFAVVALSGCGKKEEAAPTSRPLRPPSRRRPLPQRRCRLPPPLTWRAWISATLVGPDLRVAAPMATFSKQDTIIAAVATTTRDPAANVPGRLGARWTFQVDRW